MNKTIQFSIATNGYKRLFQPLIKSQQCYAARCGYYYYCLDKTPWPITPSIAAWLKVRLILKFMDLGYQRIFFVDADCSIACSAPPIFSVIDLEYKPLWIAKGKSNTYNSGVVAVANTDITKFFFRQLLDNGHNPVPIEDEAPYENGHFIHYLNESKIAGELEHNEWNNNSMLDPKSYIQHYSGGNLRKYYNSILAPKSASLALKMAKIVSKFNTPSDKFKSATIGMQIDILIEALAISKEYSKWIKGLSK